MERKILLHDAWYLEESGSKETQSIVSPPNNKEKFYVVRFSILDIYIPY